MTTVDSSDEVAPAPVLSEAKRALLTQRLRRGRASNAEEIARRPEGTAVPLSYAQERLWFMEQFAPGTAAYGVPLLIRLGPSADADALRLTLAELARRHESLRMRFPATPDGRPTVVVDPPGPVCLVECELADEAAAAAAVAAAATHPFDLATGPLLRAHLFRPAGGGEHLLLLDLHHIVTDGWSNEILLAEFAELYRSARAGEPARLAPVALGYGDYAGWQREQLAGPGARRDLEYWTRQLAGLPALELPTDAPRPATQTFHGAWHRFRLEPDLVAALAELGREHRATLFMTLLAGYQALLYRYTSQGDFAVGSPVAGRARPELDRVVGMFVTMLALRARLDDDPCFDQLVARARDTVLDGLSHQDVPFERVINELGLVRDVTRSALFQVMLVLQNYDLRDGPGAADPPAGPDVAWQPVDLPATRFDLELHAYASADGALQCRFVYNTALFHPATIERLATHLRTLLADAVARPHARVGELRLFDDAQRGELAAWNATGAPEPAGANLVSLVAAAVRRSPHTAAVTDERGTLSYAELDAAADRVARTLRAAGVGVESVVAVCAERSTELVTGLLGVLKAGAAYLPLDPEYPVQRLAHMLADSGAALVLTQRRLRDRLPETAAPVLLLDAAADPTAVDPPPMTIPSAAAAYLLYTSGSTGRPKAVVNTHRGIVNRLAWMQTEFDLGVEDVVLQKTPAGFDVSVWEFFWPLMTGARLVLARPGGHRDPAYLRELIAAQGVTTVHFVPSMLAAFLADLGPDGGDAASLRSLRRIVCSGEELPVALARHCLEVLPWASLSNLYGPTEAAVDVTAWPCSPAALDGRSRVPIGAPMRNVTVHVVDSRLRELPVGAVGELHLGGVQVARGYHGQPGLTGRCFRPDPYGEPGSRLYATGDRARWLADGTVEFLGRLDGQVKLRGQRLELGEIEAVLREQPGVADAAAAVKELGPGNSALVGYVLTAAGSGDPDGLRDALRRRLPEYMVPVAVIGLDAFPLSPNGKLDRTGLPVPEPVRPATAGSAPPVTAAQRAVAAIWAEVLGRPTPDLDDDFFALGGHSLLATQVVARLRTLTEATGRRVGVMDLFQHPTVRGLAALISSDAGAERPLLYELTKPVPAATRACSYVCVPYGGGSAAVYQPIADTLPAGHSLYSIAIPGHDVGLDEQALPFEELARRCAEEVLARVEGPLVLYGHCGVGGALVIELARRLEAAGRALQAVYVGGVFPFARPRGVLTRVHAWLDDLASNRTHAAWLKSMGVDMDQLDPAQADRIIANMRQDGRNAEAHFTTLLASQPPRLRAPIISVVGSRDPITDYYQERYREWRFLTDAAAVVVLDEAGHFFLRHRADDLVAIITSTHRQLAVSAPAPGQPRPAWWVEGVARGGDRADPGAPAEPGLRRFLTVSAGQLVSTSGSALTAWAIPVWVYAETGSLTWFGLTGMLAFLPVLVATPLAGAVADRLDRRRVIMVASSVAGAVELAFAIVIWSGQAGLGLVYVVVVLIGSAGTFQRIAFTAAIPQLAPKRYLGHANGVAQLINGVALLFVPLLAAGLLAAIGLRGILAIDVVSYVFAIGVLALVKFPDLMGRRRKETFWAQIVGGARLSWGTPAFRAMLIVFGVGNLLYAAPMLLVAPLVLAFGGLAQVGQVAFAEGLGGLIGGLAMALWGGPRRRRMPTVLVAIAAAGLFVMLTGMRANLAVAFAGVFGTALLLTMANGIYLTIIQVKVPQRFHGRVIALNQAIAWSTFPIGFAVLAPLVAGYLEPRLGAGGSLAGSVGALIGTGPGRGIGFSYLLFGLAMTVNAIAGLCLRSLARLDTAVPDAVADDLVGVRLLAQRAAPAPAPAEPALTSVGGGGV